MQTADFLADLFRAATGDREIHARCLASEKHGCGCLLNAGHDPWPCLVMPLETCSPELFWKLATEENE